MLTASFTPRMKAYERRVGRVDDMKLVVFAIDSLHLGVQTPSNHDTLKRTFSSKISSPDLALVQLLQTSSLT